MSGNARFEKRLLALETRIQSQMGDLRKELSRKFDLLQAQIDNHQQINSGRDSDAFARRLDLAVTEVSDDESAPAENQPGKLQSVLPNQPAKPFLGGSERMVSNDHVGASMRESSVTHLPTEANTNEELVSFEESTWSIFLVSESFLRADYLSALLSHLVCFLMQIYFMYMCSTEAFQGAKFDLRLQAANKWRLDAAHALEYKDVYDSSLAARVCGGDGSLVQSADHRDLLIDINYFLGMSTDTSNANFLQPALLPPGQVLCLVSILMWTLTCLSDLRLIWDIAEATFFSIGIADRTTYKGYSLHTLSRIRFTVFVLATLLRSSLVITFLVCGILWLSHTTEIEGLVLNAVALEAVLKADKLFFYAAMPSRIRRNIQSMEAMKVSLRAYRSYAEVFITLAILFVLMPLVCSRLLEPISADLLELKQIYCNGTLDFVWTYHEDLQMVGVAESRHFTGQQQGQPEAGFVNSQGNLRTATVAELIHSSSSLAYAFPTIDSLVAEQRNDAQDFATSYVFNSGESCHDQHPATTQYEYFRVTFSALKYRTGFSTCAGLKPWCNHTDLKTVRMICPITCGCNLASADPMYRTTKYGCPAGCAKTSPRPCTDDVPQTSWQRFWSEWFRREVSFNQIFNESSGSYIQLALISQRFKGVGCPYLLEQPSDPFAQYRFCDGSATFAPLRSICPVTCRCDRETLHCPLACPSRIEALVEQEYLEASSDGAQPATAEPNLAGAGI